MGNWTVTNNWANGLTYPGGPGGANNTALFTNAPASSYTAVLDSTLPNAAAISHLDPSGSGSVRVIVTNSTLTLGGAAPYLSFNRGFTLQIDNGAIVTNPSAGQGQYIWSGGGVTMEINEGGQFYGLLSFGSISRFYNTGLVTCATSYGGIWNCDSNAMGVGGANSGSVGQTNNMLRIGGNVTLTNFVTMYVWKGAGAAGPAVGNALIVENGAKLIQRSGSFNYLSYAAGDNNNLVQFGGTGAVSSIDLTGGWYLGAIADSHDNTMILTNVNATMAVLLIGNQSVGSSNNALRVLDGTTWNGKGSSMTIGHTGAGPNNSVFIDHATATNIGAVTLGGPYSGATPSHYNRMTVQNGAVVSFNSSIVLGSLKGSQSNTVDLGGAGARCTISMSGIQDSALYCGGQKQSDQTNCNYNTLTLTNVSFASTNTFAAIVENVIIGWGSYSNTINVLADTDWEMGGETLVVGNGIAALNSQDNLLLIKRGVLRNVGTVLVGKVAADTGNRIFVTDGGMLEVNKAMTIVAGSTGNTISNYAGIYQFATNVPVLTPVDVNNIAINSGTVSFRAITNADVFCNQGTKALRSDTKMAWSGTNTFRLDSATNLTTGQSYTFTDTANPTNYARLELLNGALYRGGAVAIGTHGSLMVSNGVSTISSNLTFDSTARFAVDLSSTNRYGALVAEGNVDLNGCALDISLGSAPVTGAVFPIITHTAGSTTGSFGTGVQKVTVNGTNYVLRISTSSSGAVVTCNLQTRGTCFIIE